MYAGPIEKIYGDIETQIIKNDEETTIKAIRQIGIEVDKDELIKALQYDRNQYEKGYNDALDKIRAEISELDIYYDNDYFSGNRDAMFKCNDVSQIIDKYKAESKGV